VENSYNFYTQNKAAVCSVTNKDNKITDVFLAIILFVYNAIKNNYKNNYCKIKACNKLNE
jgi:hypothetical protein